MGQRFLPFLPEDNAHYDLTDVSTRQALDELNGALASLLRAPPAEFWAKLLSQDRSLHDSIDTFLRYKWRAYDDDDDADDDATQPPAVLAAIARRVLLVLLRTVSPDAGRGAPPRSARAEGVYGGWLLDGPKLLDVAAIYGPSNPELVARLVRELLDLQPSYYADLAGMAAPLAANLREVGAAAVSMATAALAGGGSAAAAAAEVGQHARYLLDAALTLLAFARASPAAAPLLLLPARCELLGVLATLHDGALPVLERLALQPGSSGSSSSKNHTSVPTLAALRRALAALAARLIVGAFCTDGARAPLAAAAANGGGDEVAAAAAAASDPGAFGQELMDGLMAAAHAADGDGIGEAGGAGAHAEGGQMATTLLHAANAAGAVGVEVARAAVRGWVALDDAQLGYALVLLGSDRAALPPMEELATGGGAQRATTSTAAASTAAAAGPSGSGAGPSGSSISGGMPPPAELASLVSAVREVLPDYGAGYVTACLYHCGWETERVLHALLEGSPPAPVAAAGLPTSLAEWAPSPGGAGGGGAASAKGKAPMAAGAAAAAAASDAEPATGPLSWTALAADARAAAAASASSSSAIAAVPVPSGPRRARAPAPDRRTARVLSGAPGALRAATLALADEYQYEDEYDDSFDDLVNLKADGVCDAEGDGDEREAARERGAAFFGDGSGGGAAYGGPAGAPAPGPPPQGGRGGGRRGSKAERLWVLDGKVYNYAKPGAQLVSGQEGARQALAAAAAQSQEIHGLGPGGNVPLAAPQQQQQQQNGGGGGGGGGRGGGGGGRPQQQQQQQHHGGGGGRGGGGGGRGGGRDGGRGGGRGGGGGGGRGGGGAPPGGDAGDGDAGGSGGGNNARRYAFKEAHKSAIANHHRKDRAFKKMGL